MIKKEDKETISALFSISLIIFALWITFKDYKLDSFASGGSYASNGLSSSRILNKS